MGYAVLADLYTYGVVSTAFGQLTDPQKQAALDGASAYADSKMRGRYSLPLQTPYDPQIVRAVVHLAACDLLELRGFDPENPGDQAAYNRKLLAIRFFDDVQRQAAHPNVIESKSPSPAIANPTVLSSSTSTVGSFGSNANPIGPINFPPFSGSPPTSANRGL